MNLKNLFSKNRSKVIITVINLKQTNKNSSLCFFFRGTDKGRGSVLKKIASGVRSAWAQIQFLEFTSWMSLGNSLELFKLVSSSAKWQ